MKAVILAGGYGTRLSEYTDLIPKPMVEIGNTPIICHIINTYNKFGIQDFIIATGYKSNIINSFFKKYSKCIRKKNNYLLLDFKYKRNKINISCKLNLVYTGLNTMTGGRIKRIEKYIDDKNFLLTYGDGLSNIDINKLIAFHSRHKKLATLTAVRPPVRFGELSLRGNRVKKFEEKPKLTSGWINGGFFIFNRKIIKFIKDDNTVLEREPLEKLSNMNQLMAYKHEDFWQCMDTKRDKENLEKNLRKIKF